MKRDALYGSLCFCAIGLVAHAMNAFEIMIVCGVLAFVFGTFWIASTDL